MPLVKKGRGIYTRVPAEPGPPILEKMFAPDGKLAQANPNYVYRESQVDMARQVYHAMNDSRTMLVEAPCGTGKSIGYGIPAAIWVMAQKAAYTDDFDGRPRVVIVTANIALQEQLIYKDLPFLQNVVRLKGCPPFTFGLLKGRRNYACQAQIDFPVDPTELRGLTHEVDNVLKWTGTTTTGDRSELSFEPDSKVWARFSMNEDDCPGGACAFRKTCFAFKAQAISRGADIIVTNYHMLMLSVFNPELGLLPESAALILDEAHEAPDIAREMAGGVVTLGQLSSLWKRAADVGIYNEKMREESNRQTFEMFNDLKRRPEGRLKEGFPADVVQARVDSVLGQAATLHAEYQQLVDAGRKEAIAMCTALASVMRRATRLSRLLRTVMSPGEDFVASSEADMSNQGNRQLHVRLVEPGPHLRSGIFDAYPSVIATSATLSSGTSFEFIRGELGAREDTTVDILPSPFDFKKQCLLVLPTDMHPDPNADIWREQMAKLLTDVIRLVEGRTLGLFTSYRNLGLAHKAAEMDRLPYRLFRQGDAPRTQLVEEFRKDVSSVLLGTTSLWTGVDVSGEALSCVFIDKIPFPEMNDPVLGALQDKYTDEWFTRFSLPSAIMAIRQGVGRLIRSSTDKGVVVICDPRLKTKGYGSQFIKALPECRQTSVIADIQTFLGTKPVPRTRYAHPPLSTGGEDDPLPF